MEIKINISNYEAYLLDLSEGNLSYAEEKALIQFLANHPELEIDLEELPILESEAVSLQEGFKSKLFRTGDTGLAEKDHLMISSLEGELSTEERDRLGEILRSDEDAENDLAYYHKTILPADSISYPAKEELIKKESRVIPLWTTVSSIAAAILLMIYFSLPQENMYTPRGYTYEPMEYQDEETDFAFVIEEPKSNSETEDQPSESKESVQKGSNYLAATSNKNIDEVATEKKDEPKIQEPIELAPIDRQAFVELENNLPEKSPSPRSEAVSLEELADYKAPDHTAKEGSNEGKVLSPMEYARELIKKDVLKNRTFAESLKDEVESLTNKKVNFEQSEKESNAQFALNIGKLKFRKK